MLLLRLTMTCCYHRCSSPSSSWQQLPSSSTYAYTTTTHCQPHPHATTATCSQHSSSSNTKCVKTGGGRHWKQPHPGAKHFNRCQLLLLVARGRHWWQHVHGGRGVVLLLPSLLLTGHGHILGADTVRCACGFSSLLTVSVPQPPPTRELPLC